MSFYSSIASCYDYIFPAYGAQVEFLKETFGNPPKQVLDIACGTGSYSLALAKLGYMVTALDADTGMIESAKAKADLEGSETAFIHCSMEEIKVAIQGQFEGAYCIGNSLVHLETKARIQEFLKDLYDILQNEAKVVIQIVNYDRVLRHDISELPPITNEEVGLKFFRSYRVSEDKKQVAFDTSFHLKDKVEEHTTMLLPLLKDELDTMVQGAGFKVQGCYGDFSGISFDPDASYHCIFVMKK
ncbi:MAG: class I SAM-dependent methyltransferase [Niameybacter sp.]|uniref:class I SAM-dependent methyltransferase n=1 Tax=Niameybacter sp. TaxID=2033640 RepID=UPI002FC7410D